MIQVTSLKIAPCPDLFKPAFEFKSVYQGFDPRQRGIGRRAIISHIELGFSGPIYNTAPQINEVRTDTTQTVGVDALGNDTSETKVHN